MSIFGSYFHIFERGLPLEENQGYLASNYSCEEYLTTANEYGMTAGALISNNFQTKSNTFLIILTALNYRKS
jgi:hypothetical protein